MAWQMAAAKCHLEVLTKLWVWAKEVQPNSKALKKIIVTNQRQ
jgi:hypothetical protein